LTTVFDSIVNRGIFFMSKYKEVSADLNMNQLGFGPNSTRGQPRCLPLLHDSAMEYSVCYGLLSETLNWLSPESKGGWTA